MSLNKIFHDRKVIVFAGVFLLLISFFYLVLMYLQIQNSKKIINAWLDIEKPNIQQGNLLKAITSLQATTINSSSLTGISLLEIDGKSIKNYIQLGEDNKYVIREVIESEKVVVKYISFFSFSMFYKFSAKNNFVVKFDFNDNMPFLIFLFFSFNLFFVIMLSLYIIKKNDEVEYKKRESFLTNAINNLTELKQPDRILFEKIPNFVNTWNFIMRKMEKYHNDEFKIRYAEIISNHASQVAHDIRSPLAALNVIINQLDSVQEDKRVILRSSVQRINDIANDLLHRGKNNIINKTDHFLNFSIEHVPALIDIIVSEKRIQFRNKININIESKISEGYLAFAKVNLVEFKRVISNLINNSVESFCEEKGQIEILVKKKNEKSLVIINDNGKGIPRSILERLGEKGLSYGKEVNNDINSGSGLGIYHAKNTMESFGAELSISSVEGQGTTVTLTFPEASIPFWFMSQVDLNNVEKIIIVDDDSSIHQIWKGRFDQLNVKTYHFSEPVEFRNFMSSESDLDLKNAFFLMDYELLGYNETGLDLIEHYKLTNSCLVTSHYEEENIRDRCKKLDIKLIPKSLAGYVPIINSVKLDTVANNLEELDCVLIDDDNLIRMTWEMRAKTKNIKIKTYSNVDSFRRDIKLISKKTKIYIDSSLDNDIKGEIEAKKLFDVEGFKFIYLATGYDFDVFPKMSWILQIVGKSPPF